MGGPHQIKLHIVIADTKLSWPNIRENSWVLSNRRKTASGVVEAIGEVVIINITVFTFLHVGEMLLASEKPLIKYVQSLWPPQSTCWPITPKFEPNVLLYSTWRHSCTSAVLHVHVPGNTNIYFCLFSPPDIQISGGENRHVLMQNVFWYKSLKMSSRQIFTSLGFFCWWERCVLNRSSRFRWNHGSYAHARRTWALACRIVAR